MKLYIDENNKVFTMHEATSDMKCFEEFENRKPYSFVGVKELENCIHPIHVLLNTSMIDEKWIYMNLKSYISKNDRVCILPFSFFNDTKNESDWNKQYAPGQGIWYRSNQDVFYKYGIGKEQIVWVNYFKDSMDEMKEKILNSSILMLTGGAPDLMMKRIKEKKLKKLNVNVSLNMQKLVQMQPSHLLVVKRQFGLSKLTWHSHVQLKMNWMKQMQKHL